VNSLRQSIHVLGGTAVISLLQPAPETYNLFDDIILLSDGQVVYQGPREDAAGFFESMGFRCPERKGVVDFLQEVRRRILITYIFLHPSCKDTMIHNGSIYLGFFFHFFVDQVTSRKDQRQYWARPDKPYRFVPAKEFATAFKSFHTGMALAKELSVPFDKRKSHPAALTTTRYGVSAKALLKANIDWEILLIKSNSFIYIFRTFQLTLISLVVMTVFFRTKMNHDSVTSGGIYMGAMFFGILMIMYNGFSELALTVLRLPVFFKQRDLLLYPACAHTLPSWILKFPVTLMEVCGYVFLTYYVIGYDPNVGRFFKQFLIMLAVNQVAASLFRLIGGAAWNMIVANVFSMLIMMTFMRT